MLGWLRNDPVKKLKKQYESKLEEARDRQRGGDIRGYAALMTEAEKIGVAYEEAKAKADRSD